MNVGMLQRGFLMLCLLVASLLASTTLHAGEMPGIGGIECSGSVHTDSEQKQSSDEPEKSMTHHHGCHSAASFMPGEGLADHSFARSARLFVLIPATTPECRHSGPDLRPPIA